MKNTQRLGDVLNSRMQKTAGAAKTTAVELGTIGEGLSLITDSLNSSIPRGDYMVNVDLTVNDGDRVVVVWCGYEPVVISIVAGS